MSEEYKWGSGTQGKKWSDYEQRQSDYEQRQSDYDQLKRRHTQTWHSEKPVEPQSEPTSHSEEPMEPQSEQAPRNEEPNYDRADDVKQGYDRQGDNSSQAYGQSQEYSQQQAYDQQPYYNQPQDYREQPYYAPQQEPVKPKKEKKDGIGFGIASLVLGILSIFLFMTCVNYIMAILAVIFGIVQLCTRKKKGMAITGIITSVVAIFLSSLLWICVFFYIQDGGANNLYNDFYYNTDDYSTWYYDEL